MPPSPDSPSPGTASPDWRTLTSDPSDRKSPRSKGASWVGESKWRRLSGDEAVRGHDVGLYGVDDLLALRRVLGVADEALGLEVVELFDAFGRTASAPAQCVQSFHSAQ
jgi:hypothetical protein